jgi:hypothetical protein
MTERQPTTSSRQLYAVGQTDQDPAGSQNARASIKARTVHTRVIARDGFFSFEGRRYQVPDAKPGQRVVIVVGAQELEIYSSEDGSRLARHERGRPAKVLPDPARDSVSLAQVLSALPQPEVHRRPLSVYEEAAGA